MTIEIMLMLFTAWAVVSISIVLITLAFTTESYFFKAVWAYIAFLIFRNTCRYIKKQIKI